MADNIMNPAHYTVYPVQPIEITRYLGFCLGNTTKYVLRAPYKGGVEDCDKALRYLALEKETPQAPLTVMTYNLVKDWTKFLVQFFFDTPGDALWEDIAIQSGSFLEYLLAYLSDMESAHYEGMRLSVHELQRVLRLRNSLGDIYSGMTGRPQTGGR